MTRRRGFFAEIQRQAKIAERERASATRKAATARRQAEAVRNRERAARRREEAARLKATEAERKKADRQALAEYRSARQEEAASLNERLENLYHELDSILSATLEVDDYVDLERLKKVSEYPPFERKDLEAPTPLPPVLRQPDPPVMRQPDPPSGIFGRKKKAMQALFVVQEEYQRARYEWEQYVSQLPELNRQARHRYEEAENLRLSRLQTAREIHEAECRAVDEETARHNAEVDEFIANLAYGVEDVVNEYVEIVLSNSIYPDGFEIGRSAKFDAPTAELNILIGIPSPDKIPSIKSFRYIQSSDQIAESSLSQKAQKDRYSSIVDQVTLRTLHEIFEADRREIIKSISLQVGTSAINPATGHTEDYVLAAVSVGRDVFESINLELVEPRAALEGLGASISKNPWGLVSVPVGGIRK